MHAPTNVNNSDQRYSFSVDSSQAMRNRIRTIRRREKQVESLMTTCTAYCKKLQISPVDGSHGATGVHDIPRSASFLMG